MAVQTHSVKFWLPQVPGLNMSQRGIPWLAPESIAFPDPSAAHWEPDGLLAAGGALTPDWLLHAYRNGIFPWYEDDAGPILWWSPDPRAVIAPGTMRVTRSLKKRLRNGGFEVTVDKQFSRVIELCAATRKQSGTWITNDMIDAYCELHSLGYAHSVEVSQAGMLVGGLYGLALGRMFFGESMFSTVPDASKAAFYALGQHLRRREFELIDCQMMNPHLESLGVMPMQRREFLPRVRANNRYPDQTGPWSTTADLLGL